MPCDLVRGRLARRPPAAFRYSPCPWASRRRLSPPRAPRSPQAVDRDAVRLARPVRSIRRALVSLSDSLLLAGPGRPARTTPGPRAVAAGLRHRIQSRGQLCGINKPQGYGQEVSAGAPNVWPHRPRGPARPTRLYIATIRRGSAVVLLRPPGFPGRCAGATAPGAARTPRRSSSPCCAPPTSGAAIPTPCSPRCCVRPRRASPSPCSRRRAAPERRPRVHANGPSRDPARARDLAPLSSALLLRPSALSSVQRSDRSMLGCTRRATHFAERVPLLVRSRCLDERLAGTSAPSSA